MAKRSPILGYNHNVRYRGLVFHVQTEDSGVLSPHLFTHLFHEGVIVSTRKLVYDAGANEEAIKALMQAQHKAVMKDLRKGSFDDKIDQYLGGTPGLEPSANASGATPAPKGERARTDMTPPPEMLEPDAASIPLETLPANDASVPIELTVPKPARTQTAQKASPKPPKEPPLPVDVDAPTVSDNTAAVAAAIAAANAAAARAPTAQRTPSVRMSTPVPEDEPSQPEIQIVNDQGSNRARAPRDTEVSSPEITIPVTMPISDSAAIRASDQSQPMRRTPTGDRPASLGAAALPPMARPAAPRPSITPPTVMSRPLQGDAKVRRANDSGESEPVEIYAPAPPSAEPPPGERSERPGQYSMGRQKPPSDNVPLREQTGRMGVLSPPTGTRTVQPPQVRMTAPQTSQSNNRVATPPAGTPAAPAVRAEAAKTPTTGTPRAKTPTPNRAVATAPIASRSAPGNVVMTRPAVIVGAPPKPAGTPPATPRVRKAREDEGRGFGQGLISEKSLDEVILAYLSEDAEEK